MPSSIGYEETVISSSSALSASAVIVDPPRLGPNTTHELPMMDSTATNIMAIKEKAQMPIRMMKINVHLGLICDHLGLRTPRCLDRFES